MRNSQELSMEGAGNEHQYIADMWCKAWAMSFMEFVFVEEGFKGKHWFQLTTYKYVQ